MEFVAANWTASEKYFGVVIRGANSYLRGWLSGPRNSGSRSVVQFLCVVDLLLDTFCTHSGSIDAIAQDIEGAVFEAARQIILSRLQLSSQGKPNQPLHSPQYSTYELTIGYLKLVNLSPQVETDFENSGFIQGLMEGALALLDDPHAFFFYIKAFVFISDTVEADAVAKTCVECADTIIQALAERFLDFPNSTLLEYCFKTHSLFARSETLHSVSRLALNSDAFIQTVWIGVFCLPGPSHDFFNWITNVLGSDLKDTLVMDCNVGYAPHDPFAGLWISSVLFESMDVREDDVHLISTLIAETMGTSDESIQPDGVSVDQDTSYYANFNYSSSLIKLLICRINFCYAFNRQENSEFLTFLLVFIKRCRLVPAMSSTSALAKSVMDLVESTPHTRFDIGSLTKFSFESSNQIPAHLNFIKWIRLLNGDSFKVQEVSANHQANKALLKGFVIDLYVCLKTNDILS